jgi:hypothetical protein
MEPHSRNAVRLTLGVVRLSYDKMGEVPLRMSEEVGLAKPRRGEVGTINATQLRTRAAALSCIVREVRLSFEARISRRCRVEKAQAYRE